MVEFIIEFQDQNSLKKIKIISNNNADKSTF